MPFSLPIHIPITVGAARWSRLSSLCDRGGTERHELLQDRAAPDNRNKKSAYGGASAGNELFGHTTIRAQVGWCQEASVKRAVFTHCGSQIVKHDERAMNSKLQAMARERGVNARLACDGLEMVVR